MPRSDEVRFAALIHLIKKLQEYGSWCGETHIQKTTFVSEKIFAFNLCHTFVFYKYGPFSFDLRSDLTEMRAAKLLNVRVVYEGYGPSFEVTNLGEKFLSGYSEDISEYDVPFDQICSWFKDKNVRDLEKYSSAVFFTPLDGVEHLSKRVAMLTAAKPHIATKEAEQALEEVDRKMLEFRSSKIISKAKKQRTP